jgi:uncharacterized protein YkwD
MKNMTRAISIFCLFIAVAFLLAACGGGGALVASPAVSGYAAGLDHQKIERRIHELVNTERQQKGLPAMEMNNTLFRIARMHSKDMGKRNYFSHDTPEGQDFMYRYAQGGFACSVRAGNLIYTGAENIAMQYVYSGYSVSGGAVQYFWVSEEDIAKGTVKSWMDSRGHRENILTPHWKTEGIGVYIKDNGEVFITQNFC